MSAAERKRQDFYVFLLAAVLLLRPSLGGGRGGVFPEGRGLTLQKEIRATHPGWVRSGAGKGRAGGALVTVHQHMLCFSTHVFAPVNVIDFLLFVSFRQVCNI